MALYAWDLGSGPNRLQPSAIDLHAVDVQSTIDSAAALLVARASFRRYSTPELRSVPTPSVVTLHGDANWCEMRAPELQVVRYRAARARPLGAQRRAGGLGAGSPPRRLQPRRIADLRRHCRVLRGKAKF